MLMKPEAFEAIHWWITFSLILMKIDPTSSLNSLFVTNFFFYWVPVEA